MLKRLALPLFALLTACGQIMVGEDLPGYNEEEEEDDGRGNGMGNGMGNGQGRRDGGMNNPSPDAGVIEEPPCTTPEAPATWPFTASKTSYLQEFYSMSGPAACALCHEALYPPYMPPTEAALDDPTKLQDALKVWASALPTTQANGQQVPGILWHHLEGKGNTPPYFNAEQLRFAEAFVERGKDCSWAPIVDLEPAARDPMMCEPPASDLSYCAP